MDCFGELLLPFGETPRARELRDRFPEHVNADPSALLIDAKYDVSRRIEHRAAARQTPLPGEATAA